MGTRNLGERPWLVADEDFERDLALKRMSLAQRHDAVAWLTPHSHEAAAVVLELFARAGVAKAPPPTEHLLVTAALSVQEDLCLLRRDGDHWVFDASVICFPTHWHLPSKVGRPIGVVHEPVGEYDERIATRMTRLFDRVTDRPVWRRNWSFTDDTELFQPAYRTDAPLIRSDRVNNDLYIRTERQTLRSVTDGWLLFTIRVQMRTIGQLTSTPERRGALRRWVAEVPSDLGELRHMSEPQRQELLTALADPADPAE